MYRAGTIAEHRDNFVANIHHRLCLNGFRAPPDSVGRILAHTQYTVNAFERLGRLLSCRGLDDAVWLSINAAGDFDRRIPVSCTAGNMMPKNSFIHTRGRMKFVPAFVVLKARSDRGARLLKSLSQDLKKSKVTESVMLSLVHAAHKDLQPHAGGQGRQ